MGIGRGNDGPVVGAGVPAGAVAVEHKGHLVEIAVGIGAAVVDVADDHDLTRAVAVEVGDGRRAVGHVGPVFLAAVGVTAQVHRLVDMQADACPGLGLATGRAVDGAGAQGRAVVVKRGHVVRVIRADDIAAPVAVDVRQPHILVVAAGGIAIGVAVGHLGPAGAQRARMLIDEPLVVGTGRADGDFHIAVVVQVGHGQAAQFTAGAGWILRPAANRGQAGP